jgi:putative sensory transduction regulator
VSKLRTNRYFRRKFVGAFAMFCAAVLALSGLAISVTSSASAAEEAKIYKDISSREMAAFLVAANLKTTLTSGVHGEPMILAKRGKIRFIVRGVECRGRASPSSDVRCTKMQFRASFDLEAYPSATWMNEFNKSWVFGKAYVTPDGKAHVEFPLNLTAGITEGNLVNNFVTWTSVLESFIDHLSDGEIAPLL